jgi:hypothetical protein
MDAEADEKAERGLMSRGPTVVVLSSVAVSIMMVVISTV